jgi:hypothetical protein
MVMYTKYYSRGGVEKSAKITNMVLYISRFLVLSRILKKNHKKVKKSGWNAGPLATGNFTGHRRLLSCSGNLPVLEEILICPLVLRPVFRYTVHKGACAKTGGGCYGGRCPP